MMVPAFLIIEIGFLCAGNSPLASMTIGKEKLFFSLSEVLLTRLEKASFDHY